MFLQRIFLFLFCITVKGYSDVKTPHGAKDKKRMEFEVPQEQNIFKLISDQEIEIQDNELDKENFKKKNLPNYITNLKEQINNSFTNGRKRKVVQVDSKVLGQLQVEEIEDDFPNLEVEYNFRNDEFHRNKKKIEIQLNDEEKGKLEVVKKLSDNLVKKNQEKDFMMKKKPRRHRIFVEKKEDNNSRTTIKSLSKIFIPMINKHKKDPIQKILDETDVFTIRWELGRIKRQLIEKNRINMYKHIKALISKADSILRKYIRVKKGEIKEIKLRPKNYKKQIQIQEGHPSYEGHLVMLVYLTDVNNDVLASSNFIDQDDQKRTTVGFLNINEAKIIEERSSEFMKQRYVLTIVHEILHAIAFNIHDQAGIFKKEVKETQKNLQAIQNSQHHIIYNKGHWNEGFIPNDIMTEYTRSNQILSIYTLEFIENYCDKYSVIAEYLPNNFFLDSIENKVKYFDYTCKDNEEPQYNTFCSKSQADRAMRGCSEDYLFKTSCISNHKFDNNCYLKYPLKHGNCIDSSMPYDKDNNENEKFGHQSRCIKTEYESMCVEYRLQEIKSEHKKETQVYFTYKNKEYHCIRSNQSIMIHDIKFICPNIPNFINYFNKTNCPQHCNGNGFCSDGSCICFDGYDESNDCATLKNLNSEDTIFYEYVGNSNRT